MSLWSLNRPPKFKNPKGRPLVATKRGWEDPDTGEVLVAISNLITKAGSADIVAIEFVDKTPVRNEALAIKVRFNERVDVTAGAVLTVSWSGLSGNFSLHAAAQSNVHEVLFDKQSDLLTPEVVPNEAGNISVAAQTISGTVNDAGTLVASSLVVSAEAAASGGVYTVS